MIGNEIKELFGIKYPIIQAGMVWCSGWKLASAVSKAGGLGIIGAGSMHPETFEEHIKKYKAVCNRPFAVNLPLLYPEMDSMVAIIEEQKVPIVFTSAGNPKKYTAHLKSKGITVVHVVSSLKFALKAQEAGVDAVVAEGFEAGGHNGKDETTTFCLLPLVVKSLDIPVIAAGGIGDGKSMLAAFALGAHGVQIGSRFAITKESSAHQNYKDAVVAAGEGATALTLKQITPVRLIKNKFYQQVEEAESKGASTEELVQLLGKRRAKLGIFEGDLEEGELEIGQFSAAILDVPSAFDLVKTLWEDYENEKSSFIKRLS